MLKMDLQHFAESDYNWTDNGDGTCTITGYTGSVGDIEIPSTLGGLTVTHIGSEAFFEIPITGVIIPNSVISIGAGAFDRCALTSVTLPNSISSISNWAFNGNYLTELTIPDSLTVISRSVFSENQLTDITIPSSITEINSMAFLENQLTSVTILNREVSISNLAFVDNPPGLTIHGHDPSTAKDHALAYGYAFEELPPPPLKLNYFDRYEWQEVAHQRDVDNILLARTGVNQNIIINGNFDIWQRGTSGGISQEYSADRWRMGSSNQSTWSQSIDVPRVINARYSLDFVRDGGSVAIAGQRIESENMRSLIGQPITVSFWAKCTSGNLSNIHIVIESAGSKNNFTTRTERHNLEDQALSSEWRKYVFHIDSLHETCANGAELLIRGRNGDVAPWGMRVTQVQLHVGKKELPFQPRHIGEELALCQRYFTKTYNLETSIGSVTNSGVLYTTAFDTDRLKSSLYWTFPQQMRTTPSISIYNSATGELGTIRNHTQDTHIPAEYAFVGEKTAVIRPSDATVNSGDRLFVHATADAEL